VSNDNHSGGGLPPTPDEPKPKRKHRATGKPRGGYRPGAGRPYGSRNALPKGAKQALESANRAARDIIASKGADGRLGKDTDEDKRHALEHIYGRVADVLDGRVHWSAGTSVLKAAAMASDAIAGKQAEKVEHSGRMTLEQLVLASEEGARGQDADEESDSDASDAEGAE